MATLGNSLAARLAPPYHAMATLGNPLTTRLARPYHAMATLGNSLAARLARPYHAMRVRVDAPPLVWQVPNHDLGLSAATLAGLIGDTAADALLALPRAYTARRAAVQGGGTLPSDLQVAGLFARRYSPDTHRDEQPLTSFHFDSAAVTVNVALTDDAALRGGALLGVYGGAIHHIKRAEGDATVHSSTLMHGVTRMHEGVRYSLIMCATSSYWTCLLYAPLLSFDWHRDSPCASRLVRQVLPGWLIADTQSR